MGQGWARCLIMLARLEPVTVLVAEVVSDRPMGARVLLERVGGQEAGQPEHPRRFSLSGKRRKVGW